MSLIRSPINNLSIEMTFSKSSVNLAIYKDFPLCWLSLSKEPESEVIKKWFFRFSEKLFGTSIICPIPGLIFQ